jgi:hypothetical protein
MDPRGASACGIREGTAHVRRALVGLAAILGSAAVITACQEKLTSPAECPGLCPGGPQALFETVLSPLAGLDSSFHTYVAPGQGSALLVSSGLPASEDRAVYRFAPRPDSVTVRDTARAYTVDSVVITVNIIARDTLVGGLNVLLFRLPPTVDSTATFESVDPQLGTNLIDTIAVPDSLHSGQIKAVLQGSDLDRVALPAGTGGVLAMGLRLTAAAPTGIRVGTLAAGNGATFVSYLTVDVPDTGSVRNQVLTSQTAFNTFVTQNRSGPDPTLLTVGGDSSSRSIVRFELPPQLKDSATIIRATLELVPAHPLLGLPGDPAVLSAHAVLADLGAKSPINLTDGNFISSDTLPEGTTDTLRLEVTRLVRLWQGATVRPAAIFLVLRPEASTFTRAAFGSTNPASPVGPPRLLVTYQLPFPFEIP